MDVKESLVEPQLWNRYSYVTNNPLRYTDPDGSFRDGYGEKPMHTMGNNAPPVIAAALTVPVNVARHANTAQLKDFMNYEQSLGIKFVLEARKDTVLSKPLQKLVDAKLIELHRTLPPR
jgi:hypothetical protein